MSSPALCASAVAGLVPLVRHPLACYQLREFDSTRDTVALQRLADIHAGFGRFDAKRVCADGVIVAEGPDGLVAALHSCRSGTGAVSQLDLLVVATLAEGTGVAQRLLDAYLAGCEGAGVLTCVAPIPESAPWRAAAEAMLVRNHFSVTGHDPAGVTWACPSPSSPWNPLAYGASHIFSRALHRRT